jgi:hypothetical protein
MHSLCRGFFRLGCGQGDAERGGSGLLCILAPSMDWVELAAPDGTPDGHAKKLRGSGSPQSRNPR